MPEARSAGSWRSPIFQSFRSRLKAVSQWVSTVRIFLWSSRAFASTVGGVWAAVQEARTRMASRAETAIPNIGFFMFSPELRR